MKTRGKLRPVYGEAEVERALLCLAECSGNGDQAARLLAEDGLPIDGRTLRRWRSETHAARYEQVRNEVLPALRASAADRHSALADRQLEVSEAMTERLAREVEGIPVRDLPGGVRNVIVAAAVNRDKSQLLADQPTQIVGGDPLRRSSGS